MSQALVIVIYISNQRSYRLNYLEYKERGIIFNTLALGAVQTEMLAEAFPDYKANISPQQMAHYIADFALNGSKVFNGKVLQVANTTP